MASGQLHPRRSAQDVLLCKTCNKDPVQLHCELCNIDLCGNCVGKHVVDFSKQHKVIPFIEKFNAPTYPKCPTHADRQCELFCEQCNIPVCSTCVSNKHRGHVFRGVLDKQTEAVSPPLVKPLLDEPRLTATIDTGYGYLYSVSCVGEDQVWMCGEYDKTMKLLNLWGKLQTSIQTKSGWLPGDIAVTRDGDLVYTDPKHKTVNLVKNNQTLTVITLQGWVPLHVCCTASGDVLVTMDTDDREQQSKVVRYSGSTEKQSIQYDVQGRPLYSSGDYTKYISENRNLDICLADNRAGAVVVVNAAGRLRFRYTGHPSDTGESFDPRGLTTDSQGHIIVGDSINHRVHILDQDGQFLRYIHCDLSAPWGLCVDIRDNLFAAEWWSAKIKKIQYL